MSLFIDNMYIHRKYVGIYKLLPLIVQQGCRLQVAYINQFCFCLCLLPVAVVTSYHKSTGLDSLLSNRPSGQKCEVRHGEEAPCGTVFLAEAISRQLWYLVAALLIGFWSPFA